jgi:hypothetical protein
MILVSENLVRREAVCIERDSCFEPELRLLTGELRCDPERRSLLQAG